MTEEQYNTYTELKAKLDNHIQFLRALKYQIDVKRQEDAKEKTHWQFLKYFAGFRFIKDSIGKTVLHVSPYYELNRGANLEADEDTLLAFMVIVEKKTQEIQAQIESL